MSDTTQLVHPDTSNENRSHAPGLVEVLVGLLAPIAVATLGAWVVTQGYYWTKWAAAHVFLWVFSPDVPRGYLHPAAYDQYAQHKANAMWFWWLVARAWLAAWYLIILGKAFHVAGGAVPRMRAALRVPVVLASVVVSLVVHFRVLASHGATHVPWTGYLFCLLAVVGFVVAFEEAYSSARETSDSPRPGS